MDLEGEGEDEVDEDDEDEELYYCSSCATELNGSFSVGCDGRDCDSWMCLPCSGFDDREAADRGGVCYCTTCQPAKRARGSGRGRL